MHCEYCKHYQLWKPKTEIDDQIPMPQMWAIIFSTLISRILKIEINILNGQRKKQMCSIWELNIRTKGMQHWEAQLIGAYEFLYQVFLKDALN